jgi:pimeloyl-ACP methyl ester carboxylesterase
MHVAEAGSGPPVILAHGFPELWFSWRHQLPALADAGCHAIAPDQRGYGRSDVPDRVEDYDITKLTGDLLGLLDALGEERAVFVGHDWGAIVVWALALIAPERVRGVAGLSVPFTPRGPIPPTHLFDALSGDRFFYILYFQEPGVADRELASDTRRTMASILYSASAFAPPGSIKRMPREGTGYLDVLTEPPELPPWLTEEDLELYVSEFQRTGFTGPLSWYRNFDRNWELMEPYAGAKVEVPALFLAGERDTVLKMLPPDVMDGWVADLRGSILIPGAGHWVQQERPDEVNRALVEFVSGLA